MYEEIDLIVKIVFVETNWVVSNRLYRYIETIQFELKRREEEPGTTATSKNVNWRRGRMLFHLQDRTGVDH